MPASPFPPALTLSDPADVAIRLARRLPDGYEVAWVDTTGSTNADMRARLRTQAGDWRGPLLLGSHGQSAGRGRAGRSWQAQPGDALLFTCGLRTELPRAALPPLSIVAGIAACEALAGLLPPENRQLGVKWPNDLQWGNAKLAGILAETVVLPHGAQAQSLPVGIALGIGINLRGAAALSAELGRPVADWAATGCQADPIELVSAIAQAWQQAIELFTREGFAAFMPRFATWDALAQRDVSVVEGQRTLYEGVACGVDEQGHLLVRTANGMQRVTVGDVSIRAGDPA